MPLGLTALISAQSFAAVADNALLVVALALPGGHGATPAGGAAAAADRRARRRAGRPARCPAAAPGNRLPTAGRSIGVRNFNENAGVLVMLAAHAGLRALEPDIPAGLALFGGLVAKVTALPSWRSRRRLRASAPR